MYRGGIGSMHGIGAFENVRALGTCQRTLQHGNGRDRKKRDECDAHDARHRRRNKDDHGRRQRRSRRMQLNIFLRQPRIPNAPADPENRASHT